MKPIFPAYGNRAANGAQIGIFPVPRPLQWSVPEGERLAHRIAIGPKGNMALWWLLGPNWYAFPADLKNVTPVNPPVCFEDDD
jgi:hypothetical protein